jgi:VIT1/CCC1 family predicted Fe2+/Mn2+ transporter/rubrerythrin
MNPSEAHPPEENASSVQPVDAPQPDAAAESQRRLLAILQHDWALEMDGVDMYNALAEREKNPERKTVFRKLGETEQRHAQLWAKRLQELNAPVPASHSGKGHAVRIATTPGDLQQIILAIEAEERRDVADYTRQMRHVKDEATSAILREIILDEYAQAQVLRRLYTQSSPRSALAYLLQRERQGTGSWIGDAVYGVNDGLGSIFGIVSGVSGATLGNSKYVLLAGLAGMIASALSMGSGAYLAAKSEREIYEAALHREREALTADPAEAREEMAIFYQLKGIPEEDAAKIADYLAARPEQFLRTLAVEKLNLSEEALSNPVTSSVSGSLSTAVGAFIPILPFFFVSGYPAVIAAAIVSLVAHFAVGAAKSLVTVRSWWSSGLEMTVVGTVEGIITYLIGIGLGHIGA